MGTSKSDPEEPLVASLREVVADYSADEVRVALDAVLRERAKCVVCGKPFPDLRPNRTYCSNPCRQKAWRQRHAASTKPK